MCSIDWSALGTWAAVVVALFLPFWERRRQRVQAEQDAMLVLPAIADELKWIADIAEEAIQVARRGQQASRRSGDYIITNDLSAHEKQKLATLVSIQFPVYEDNKAVLMGAPNHVVLELSSRYGDLYRHKIRVEQVKKQWPGGTPNLDVLKAFDSSAGGMLAAARRAYCFVADVAKLEVPKEWDPKSPVLPEVK